MQLTFSVGGNETLLVSCILSLVSIHPQSCMCLVSSFRRRWYCIVKWVSSFGGSTESGGHAAEYGAHHARSASLNQPMVTVHSRPCRYSLAPGSTGLFLSSNGAQDFEYSFASVGILVGSDDEVMRQLQCSPPTTTSISSQSEQLRGSDAIRESQKSKTAERILAPCMSTRSASG